MVKRPASEMGDPAECFRPPHSPSRFEELGSRLRAGKLVAFPTETVYGLGANGLDAAAVLKIFEAKGRPLTDPCILHVAEPADALKILDLGEDPEALALFQLLAENCWPGPLSLVAPARKVVPLEVTASTAFVAVRCPAHPVAQELLRAARVPLAAPSANRFGHISPTTADHVLEDLSHVEGLRVLDGGPCSVGIESTVVKLELQSPPSLRVLRLGGLTRPQLSSVLDKGLAEGRLRTAVVTTWPEPRGDAAASVEDQPQEAPGMMLKHYAPAVRTVLLSTAAAPPNSTLLMPPAKSLLIDFAGQLRPHQDHFMKVFDLCNEAHDQDPAEAACRQVFTLLREAEAYALSHGAELICITELAPSGLGTFLEALRDRLFRSASGCRATLMKEDGAMVLRTM